MRFLSLVLVLGGILIIVYYLAGDIVTVEKGGRNTAFDATGAAANVVDKVNTRGEMLKTKIDNLTQ